MGIKMICTKAFRPGGSGSPMLQPGSPFEAPGQSLARTYRAMGWAEDTPELVVEPPKRAYTRKVMEPAKTELSTDTSERRYQRRDMTAKTED